MTYSYRIEQAIRAAAVLHKGQVRRGSVPLPYVTHLFAVMIIASDYTDDEDILVAALLHDTIEDTDYTLEELQADFGGNVRDIVAYVTEPSGKDDAHSLSSRKKTYLKQIKSAPEEALTVVAADKIHNMRSVIEEYYDDASRFIADFGDATGDRLLMYQEISNTLNRNLKSDIVHEFNHVFSEYKNFIERVERNV